MRFSPARFFEKYLRPTSGTEIPAIDGIRGITILMVVVFHVVWYAGEVVDKAVIGQAVAAWWMRPVLYMPMGVDVFFFIAAFLAAGSIVRRRENGTFQPVAYWKNRFLRILPDYLIVFAFYMLVRGENPLNCGANFVFLNNFLPYTSQCMGWTWYLAAQEQFLFVLPLLFLVLRKRLLMYIVMAIVFIAVVPVRSWLVGKYGIALPLPFHPVVDAAKYHQYFDILYNQTLTRLPPLLAGAAAGIMLANERTRLFIRGINRWWIFAFLAFLFFNLLQALVVINPHAGVWPADLSRANLVFMRHSTAAVLFLLYVPLLADNPALRLLALPLSWSVWRIPSRLSLSIYLVHPVIITLIYKLLTPRPADPVFMILMSAAAILLSIIFALGARVLIQVVTNKITGSRAS